MDDTEQNSDKVAVAENAEMHEDTSTSTSSSSSDDNPSDSEYIPSEDAHDKDDGSEEDDDGSEDDEESEDVKAKEAQQPQHQLVFYVSAGGGAAPMNCNGSIVRRRNNKRQKVSPEEEEFIQYLDEEEWSYWEKLNGNDKQKILSSSKAVSKCESSDAVMMPLKFRILQSPMDFAIKRMLLGKLDNFKHMREGSSEYTKLRGWLNSVSRIPLGMYRNFPVQSSDSQDVIATFIQSARQKLDDTVYGHTEVKDQIMRIIAQWISNPSSKGHCIGLQGEAGVGKTKIIKDGVTKALDLPFGFIALGGASDGSFLEGHGFTYEGSTYGKIADILMKSGCMNPIIFFDELDKVSTSSRGEEIIGILTHLTDPSQNDRFCDRYFSEIDLDLSKALLIFSYNDETAINPILKDRMITINVPGYSKEEKIKIAKHYLLPDILVEHNFNSDDITIKDDVLENIVESVGNGIGGEKSGVRDLKRALESIVSWINMHRYLPDKNTGSIVNLPVEITSNHVDKYMKVPKKDECPISHMYL